MVNIQLRARQPPPQKSVPRVYRPRGEAPVEHVVAQTTGGRKNELHLLGAKGGQGCPGTAQETRKIALTSGSCCGSAGEIHLQLWSEREGREEEERGRKRGGEEERKGGREEGEKMEGERHRYLLS